MKKSKTVKIKTKNPSNFNKSVLIPDSDGQRIDVDSEGFAEIPEKNLEDFVFEGSKWKVVEDSKVGEDDIDEEEVEELEEEEELEEDDLDMKEELGLKKFGELRKICASLGKDESEWKGIKKKEELVDYLLKVYKGEEEEVVEESKTMDISDLGKDAGKTNDEDEDDIHIETEEEEEGEEENTETEKE
jgi:hypothetical protein